MGGCMASTEVLVWESPTCKSVGRQSPLVRFIDLEESCFQAVIARQAVFCMARPVSMSFAREGGSVSGLIRMYECMSALSGLRAAEMRGEGQRGGCLLRGGK